MKAGGTQPGPDEPAGRSAWRAVLWFGLAVLGQAASLRMIDAGPILRYQHYRPVADIAAEAPWLLGVVVVQAVLVGMALVGWRSTLASRSGRLSPVRIALAAVLSVATAATVSPDPMRYVAELGFAASLQLLNMLTILVMVFAVPASVVDRLVAALDRMLGVGGGYDDEVQPAALGRDRFGWSVAAIAFTVAALLSLLSYERHPHVPDEVSYLHHARYLAAGMLTMPAPPVREAFEIDLMTYEPTRWFSPVPPGWPAVLSLGVLAGVPWLVNPFLSGLSVLLAYGLLRELYAPRIARVAAALLALSPWFLFLGMSYMTQTLTLTCALAAAYGVARARRTGSAGWSLVAGLAVGATSLIRPLDGLLIGLLIAMWAMGIGGRRLRVPALAALLFGTVVAGAAVYPYNRAMTGDGLRFPISAYADALWGPNSNAYGFGTDRGLGWAFDPNPGSHGPADAIVNANLNTFGINTDLFGWSTGSLILVALLLTMGRFSRADRQMLGAGLVIFTGYFFYYFSGGPDFGARYWFPVIVPLVALSARGLQTLELATGPRARVAVGALVLMSLVIYVPWRGADKYHHYRGMRPDVRALAVEHGFGADLVLVSGNRFPDYASAAVENPIDLRAPQPIYAWDRSAEVRAETLRAYPDRRVWLLEGPTITGNGFRVAAGPLRARDLLGAEVVP